MKVKIAKYSGTCSDCGRDNYVYEVTSIASLSPVRSRCRYCLSVIYLKYESEEELTKPDRAESRTK